MSDELIREMTALWGRIAMNLLRAEQRAHERAREMEQMSVEERVALNAQMPAVIAAGEERRQRLEEKLVEISRLETTQQLPLLRELVAHLESAEVA